MQGTLVLFSFLLLLLTHLPVAASLSSLLASPPHNLLFSFFLSLSLSLLLSSPSPLGVTLGTVTVSIASTFGACVAFWICRVTARGWLEPKLRETNEFRFFFYLFQSKKYKMVSVLARLAPIPFGLQNSFFAVCTKETERERRGTRGRGWFAKCLFWCVE